MSDWRGDLNDDCTLERYGFNAHVECMDRRCWWFSVGKGDWPNYTELYNHADNRTAIKLTTGEMARAAAECMIELLANQQNDKNADGQEIDDWFATLAKAERHAAGPARSAPDEALIIKISQDTDKQWGRWFDDSIHLKFAVRWAIREYIRRSAQGGEQSDTVSVPREPTEAMLAAYVRTATSCGAPTWFDAIRAGYAAMLATVKSGEQSDTVSVPSDKDNPVVGHKTLQNGEHIPLRKDEADALLAQVRLSEKQRRAAMPDEKSAINALFNAWIRLKDFGWRDADYCPKDGSSFLALECGSTGIHTAHYQGDQFKGSIWIESNGDLWPSEPVLFKLAATKEGK